MSKKQHKNRQGSHLPLEPSEQMMLNRSQQLLEPQEYQALLAELDQPLRSSFRINPLKIKSLPSDYALELSQHYQWQIEQIPYCDHGWWVAEAGISLGQTWDHRLGNYYIQDASSMLPVELFQFESLNSAPLILDMAASPGGKTTHLISKTADKALVIANDASKDRVTALRLVLQTWGSANHAITQFPGEKIGGWFPETFDYVLLDAPCSMQNLRSTEARPMRSISMREEQSLAQRQKILLESALQTARVGGQIVYATCTLMPDEDEAVLDWLLHKYPEAVRIEDMQSLLPQPAPALSADETQTFHADIKNAFRVWPHRMSSSGFFTARLTKTASITKKTSAPPQFDITRTDFQPLESDLKMSLLTAFSTQFEVTLDDILETFHLSVWQLTQQAGIQALAFPERYFEVFGGLPVRSMGLPIALWAGDLWQPDHQWISRFYSHFYTCSILLPDNFRETWLKGEDIMYQLPSQPSGSYVIFKDQRNQFMGIGRQQENRIKNLLPKRMVL